jgi:hypothetical protein
VGCRQIAFLPVRGGAALANRAKQATLAVFFRGDGKNCGGSGKLVHSHGPK